MAKMPYKDKDKQKEANRQANKRYRAKGITPKLKRDTPAMIPGQALPANFGQPDCACLHCRANKANGGKLTINHGSYKTADQLEPNEVNRVSLPGDPDYGKAEREGGGGGTKAGEVQ